MDLPARLPVFCRSLGAITAGSMALFLGCAFLGCVLLGCGEQARDLEEWTPADHQPAAGGAGVPEDEGEGPGVGAALYSVHCATCHGPTGRGDGPGAPPMARVPNLTDPELAARRSDAEVEVLILAGRGFMPGFERSIPREGIRAIVEYVRTLAPIAAVPEIAPEGAAPLEAPPAEAPAEAPPTEAPPAEVRAPRAPPIPSPPSTDRPPPAVRTPIPPDPEALNPGAVE